MTALAELAKGLAGGKIKVVDLTETLSPEFPHISLPPEMGQGAVRLSVGRYTTEEEVDEAAEALVRGSLSSV